MAKSRWIAHKAAKRYPKYGVQKGWERVTAAKVDADGFVELTDKEANRWDFRFEGLLYIVGYRSGYILQLPQSRIIPNNFPICNHVTCN